MMKKLESQTITTYDIGQGFRVDVVKIRNKTEIWYYHKNYGIKELDIGFKFDADTEELIKLNAEKYKYYYRLDYMEEE